MPAWCPLECIQKKAEIAKMIDSLCTPFLKPHQGVVRKYPPDPAMLAQMDPLVYNAAYPPGTDIVKPPFTKSEFDMLYAQLPQRTSSQCYQQALRDRQGDQGCHLKILGSAGVQISQQFPLVRDRLEPSARYPGDAP
jgi:hypothetical protein